MGKKNHYETLGVAENAQRDEIRNAFRNKMKTAHPDTGGTHEESVALQRAYATLNNEAHRSRYDQTGCDPSEPTKEEQISKLLGDLFCAIIEKVTDIEATDIVKIAEEQIRALIANLSEQQAAYDRKAMKFAKAAKRLKKKTGENAISAMLLEQVKYNEEQEEKTENEINTAKDLLKQVVEFEYATMTHAPKVWKQSKSFEEVLRRMNQHETSQTKKHHG